MISVVMPVLNEEKLIENSLQTLKKWKELELIVADGGSTDKTVQLAEPHARVVTSARGRAVQMNAGAHVAQGDILWFVHVDTLLLPNSPSHVQNAIDQGFIGGAFSTRFDKFTPFWDRIAWLDNHRARMFHIYYGSRAMFVRADVFHALGGFPEIAFLEDVALSRLLRKTGRTVMLDAVALESLRRFEKKGTIRQILLDIVLLTAFELRISPKFLARFYEDIR
jgi:rSAM/selenodomain-associated transferase 2